MAIDFTLSPELEDLRMRVRTFVDEVIKPTEARIPTDPTPSQTTRLALVGALLALLAGIVLAFVLEFVKNLRQDSAASRSAPQRVHTR